MSFLDELHFNRYNTVKVREILMFHCDSVHVLNKTKYRSNKPVNLDLQNEKIKFSLKFFLCYQNYYYVLLDFFVAM